MARSSICTVLLKKLDGLRDCTTLAEPKRGMRREHAPSKRVEQVQSQFCSRDAKKPHAQPVSLFDNDCSVVYEMYTNHRISQR
ncbi:hypothetical protein Y032_0206g1982 [Ancylostoma ceylanicum]|uniref:Uncharacterized protein n=1 Tax=Ancylostoma ceylanicum TaxID=53326 RepID=A0A016SM29_9BILA|nr:hypothetical protein Y032_0206g1982 [Ancylostoma ceylanicum]